MGINLYQFAVAGGDLRQWYLAKKLAERGYQVLTYDLCKDAEIPSASKVFSVRELVKEADVLIYPIPFLKSKGVFGMERSEGKVVLQNLRRGQFFFAGYIPKLIYQEMESKGVHVFDLMNDKSLSVQNSVATAEGMIAEAMIQSPKKLRGSRCMILGYGTCGRTLASYLKGIGCEVKVLEKCRWACAYAMADGMQIVEKGMLYQELEQTDMIFNTVPELLLGGEQLAHVPKEGVVLDIASGTGGVDYAAARKLGVQAVHLPGLPGKYAPYSSADIIADTVLWKLEESIT